MLSWSWIQKRKMSIGKILIRLVSLYEIRKQMPLENNVPHSSIKLQALGAWGGDLSSGSCFYKTKENFLNFIGSLLFLVPYHVKTLNLRTAKLSFNLKILIFYSYILLLYDSQICLQWVGEEFSPADCHQALALPPTGSSQLLSTCNIYFFQPSPVLL